jgi:hypothetical protein
MAEEKKNNKADDSINLFLEQALTRHSDEMMENFSNILQRLPITTCTSSSNNHFGGTSPFKVQVNFDITIFEGHIDADALEKWLNPLEGYFFVHNFSDREKITFAILKALSHVKRWWEIYWEKISTEESGIYGVEPTWYFFVDAVKEQYYPIGNYEDQYMRRTTVTHPGHPQAEVRHLQAHPEIFFSYRYLFKLIRTHKIKYLMTCTTITNKHAYSKYSIKR